MTASSRAANADVSSLRRQLYADLTKMVVLRRPRPRNPSASPAGALVDALHAASPHQDPIDPMPLPEIDGRGVTHQEVLRATDGLTRPVVLRGLQADTPAVKTWTAAALEARCGDVRCMPFRLQDAEAAASGQLPIEEMSLSAYLRRMNDERLYVNNATDLFTADPSLIDDLQLDRLEQALTGGGFFSEFMGTQLFISAAHVHSALHCAPAGNAFTQIAGRKRWTLIGPEHSAELHPIPALPFQFAVSGTGGFKDRLARGQGLGFLARVPRYVAELDPGDVLYNAPWWWHEVENLTPYTVGCAIRHMPQPWRRDPTWSNHPLMTSLSIYPSSRALILAMEVGARALGRDLPLLQILNRGLTRRIRKGLGANAGR